MHAMLMLAALLVVFFFDHRLRGGGDDFEQVHTNHCCFASLARGNAPRQPQKGVGRICTAGRKHIVTVTVRTRV